MSKEKRRNDESIGSELQLQRRQVAAGLAAALGALALSACAKPASGELEGDIGTGIAALNGTTNIRWVDTVASLRALAGAANWVAILEGYAAVNDGGGGLFVWSTVAAADDGGTVLNSGGLGSSAAGWRRVREGTALNVKWFGAIADYNPTTKTGTSNNAAFTRALNALKTVPNTAKGGVLIVDGYYYFTATLHITNRVEIRGTGRNNPATTLGGVWQPGTMLVFPGNMTALRLHGMVDFNEPGWTNPGTNNFSAGFSTLRDLTVYCKDPGVGPTGGGTSNTSGHGIHFSCPVTIDNVHVEGFGGHGIACLADHTSNGGNANGSLVMNCLVGVCNGDGVHNEGGDSNGMHYEKINVEFCNGYGFYDNSQGSNTFISCLGEGNHEGFPRVPANAIDFKLAGNTPSVFSGCYSECGASEILFPGVVIGGNLGSPGRINATTTTAFVLDAGIAFCAPFQYWNLQVPGHQLNTTYGSQDTSLTIIGWTVDANNTAQKYDVNTGWSYFETDNNTSFRPFAIPHVTNNGTYSPPSTKWAPAFGNGINFGDFRNGAAALNNQNYGAAQPASGTYNRGDIVWNSGAVSGAHLGWVCIAGGTPGTWKSLGSISATSAPASGTWQQGDVVFNAGAAAAGDPVGWICTAGGSPGVWRLFGSVL